MNVLSLFAGALRWDFKGPKEILPILIGIYYIVSIPEYWGTKYGVYYLGMSQHLEYGEVVLNGFTGYARPPYAFFGGKFVTVDTLYRVIPVALLFRNLVISVCFLGFKSRQFQGDR